MAALIGRKPRPGGSVGARRYTTVKRLVARGSERPGARPRNGSSDPHRSVPQPRVNQLGSARSKGAQARGARHAHVGATVKTTRERAEERRTAKLEQIAEQVASGSLVIRTMSDEERERFPPRARAERGSGRSRPRPPANQ
jgi:hypothetical protein